MLIAIAAGVALGFLYSLSPMSVWFVVLGAALVRLAMRGLSPREARWVAGLLITAMAIRAVIVAALFLFGSPDRIYVPFNVFFGDEQYMIVRALRQRAVWLDLPMRVEQFSDAFEIYGRTSYLQVIAVLQLLVGPSPYGVHLFNILLYVGGGIILHRIVRTAFGRVPALGALAFLLFLPSMMLWSTTALKESLNFFVVVSMLGSAVIAIRGPARWRIAGFAGVVLALAMLTTLRDGAVAIGLAGLAVGLGGALATRKASSFVAATMILMLVCIAGFRLPRVQAAAMRVVFEAANKHIGHAYTRGHSYELLDTVYYGHRPVWTMTATDAAHFVGRGIASMVIFPAPWQVRSRSELVYLPEQMLWYVVVFAAAIGVVAGFQRDRLVTCLFAGYAAVALVAVGVNSGNMGTLVRHRAFALPYVGALAVLGIAAVLTRFGSSRQGRYASDR
jgi:hypothetical protein